MNLDKGINYAIGSSLLFLSYGGIRSMKSSKNQDKCTTVNLNLGLSSLSLTGLLMLVREFYR